MSLSSLRSFHALPADEAVDISCEERREADHGAQITAVGQRRQRPQDHQYHIVTGIGDRVVRTAARGQVDGGKTAAHGEGGRDQIHRAERAQDKVEESRHGDGQYREQEPLVF